MFNYEKISKIYCEINKTKSIYHALFSAKVLKECHYTLAFVCVCVCVRVCGHSGNIVLSLRKNISFLLFQTCQKKKRTDSIWIREKTEAPEKQTANNINQKMNDFNEFHVPKADSNEVFFHII